MINNLAVRWDTEHEVGDLRRLFQMVGDDVAIGLDRSGWMIVMKPECRNFKCSDPRRPDGNVESDLWAMNQPSDATPLWATESPAHGPLRKISYRPYPSAAESIFGFDWETKPEEK